MWHLESQFSGGLGSPGLTVGLGDLRGLFQLTELCDFIQLSALTISLMQLCLTLFVVQCWSEAITHLYKEPGRRKVQHNSWEGAKWTSMCPPLQKPQCFPARQRSWLPCKTSLISSLGYLANTNHVMDTPVSSKVRTYFLGAPQAVDLWEQRSAFWLMWQFSASLE